MRHDQQRVPNSGVGGVMSSRGGEGGRGLTSLQEEPDVVCVVDLYPVTAGQSVQQRCLPYEVEGG